jgi:hypothetical protein
VQSVSGPQWCPTTELLLAYMLMKKRCQQTLSLMSGMATLTADH